MKALISLTRNMFSLFPLCKYTNRTKKIKLYVFSLMNGAFLPTSKGVIHQTTTCIVDV